MKQKQTWMTHWLMMISLYRYVTWKSQTSPGNKPELQNVLCLTWPEAFYVTFNNLGKRRPLFDNTLKTGQKSIHHPLFGYPAGLCTLATVCCYLAGMDLLHRVSMLPDKVDGSLGWSLYLALISSPLHMMAAALLVWAARSHSQSYYRMSAYRVA